MWVLVYKDIFIFTFQGIEHNNE